MNRFFKSCQVLIWISYLHRLSNRFLQHYNVCVSKLQIVILVSLRIIQINHQQLISFVSRVKLYVLGYIRQCRNVLKAVISLPRTADRGHGGLGEGERRDLGWDVRGKRKGVMDFSCNRK